VHNSLFVVVRDQARRLTAWTRSAFAVGYKTDCRSRVDSPLLSSDSAIARLSRGTAGGGRVRGNYELRRVAVAMRKKYWSGCKRCRVPITIIFKRARFASKPSFAQIPRLMHAATAASNEPSRRLTRRICRPSSRAVLAFAASPVERCPDSETQVAVQLSYRRSDAGSIAFSQRYFIISIPAAALVRRIGYMRSAVTDC